MTKENSNRIDKTTLNRLKSENTDTAIEAISELKEKGHAGYVPILIELLHTSDNPEIKSRIFRLLAELKQSDAIPLIIDAIENKKYANERQQLVSACWENGLDYSHHLSLFVDLVIENDLEIAFEAYTVITNMSGKISKEIADKESEKLKRAMLEADDQQKQLMHDLLDFLPAFERGIEPQTF
ncbi:HEAT repeat domain-containing protein [uncultured Sunxiuqinia sp.]|uniref:HEAT repeat domain-containing protein n=1 Tax=uncultured Sunxiuqinia sp. TaxID=1573825 RepID=UPI002AA937EB|nr:HEAT repeat domain-containing protein [uncultured Sunxiuqinia sp.]